MADEDLPRRAGRPALADVVHQRLVDVSEQGKLELLLALRLYKHDPLLSPIDAVEAETAAIVEGRKPFSEETKSRS